jgi:hypothetical protein
LSEEVRLNAKEKAAIAALRRLESKWPDTLMIYAGTGSISVVKLREDGSVPMSGDGYLDPKSVVETITGIPNDGGDPW